LYNFDMGCYVLDEKTDILVMPFDCFADFYPLAVYEIRRQSTVILRHQLIDRE